eukprot:SAG22_NODE_718_length_7670_cov_11.194690_3_plen_118_part_00
MSPVAAEADPDEETTAIKVFDTDGRITSELKQLRDAGLLDDVTLVAGSTAVRAHRIVLAALSPHLKAMFTSGMAESASREVPLHEVDGTVLERIVAAPARLEGPSDHCWAAGPSQGI